MAKQYIKRDIDIELINWVKDNNRKPLLLRGARQIGKTASVRNIADSFKHYIEINFEEQKDIHKLFDGDLSPDNLCRNISALFNTPIIEGKTLLFFDEIQSCIPAISSLRFFYEKLPNLHVIATGSLLEFALEELPSFGVGRIRSIFMYPFSFDEFLSAFNENSLLEVKKEADYTNPIPIPLHNKLLQYLKQYLIIGGMPEVVSNFVTHNDFLKCQTILDDLTLALKADFSKYKKRVPSNRISEVFESVVQQAGGKFIYSKAATQSNHRQVKEAIDLLIKAGLIIPVIHSSANGIPLGAERNVKKMKLLLFDTGVFQRLLGLDISDIILADNFQLINKGSIAEQYAGLEILKSSSSYSDNQLFYWHRESVNSNAEIDYIVQKSDSIIPIEVKSGTKGSMRSMNIFLEEKNRELGCWISLENYSSYKKIIIYPLYAVSDFIKKRHGASPC